MRYHFTYETKNLINEKTYIGVHSTNNLNDGYLGSGIVLQRAIKKHGRENFVMTPLAFFDTPEEAFEEERFLVDEKWVKSQDNYNEAVGGCGGNVLKGACEEKIKRRNAKIRQANTGKGNGMFGRKHSKSTLKKMRLSCNNVKENNPFYNKKHTQESRNKISQALSGRRGTFKGKTHKEDTLRKMSKWVYKTPLGEFYGAYKAAKAHECNPTTIELRAISTSAKWVEYTRILNEKYYEKVSINEVI